jgi:hypothetical protein
MRKPYKILSRKPEVKRPLRRASHGWQDNIRLHLKDTDFEGMDWIHLAQDRN